ncbi:hypothetical protein [Flagellimonas flava]|uniref:hypothetical protein n=1 Tax=Flagellimonas flava TaxID=570519 RepID=UPI003D646E3E
MLSQALDGVDGGSAALLASRTLAASDNLKARRKAFAKLSNKMEVLIRGKIKSGKLYKDFCPMAMGGGAYWLSSMKDIRNPYYG